MPTWVKYLLALVIPAFAFLILKDTVGGFYYGGSSSKLSYVVVEPEEAEIAVDDAPVVEEVPEAEEAPAEDPPADAAPAEKEVAVAETPEEAPVEEAVTAEELTEAAEEEAPVLDADPATATELVAALSEDEMATAARAARACSSCHQFERERNGAGPHLVGIGGRTIGSVDGFRYSDALLEWNAAGAIWTADELDAWLAGPADYAPGTKMNFVVRDPEERRLIAEWLVQKDQ